MDDSLSYYQLGTFQVYVISIMQVISKSKWFSKFFSTRKKGRIITPISKGYFVVLPAWKETGKKVAFAHSSCFITASRISTVHAAISSTG